MGRNRGTKRDAALPEYVYRIQPKDRVIWREYAGQGRFGKTVTLRDDRGRPLPADAPHRAIIAAYQRQIAAGNGHTLEWLLKAYLDAPKIKPMAERTLRDYRYYVEAISAKPTQSGRFGDVALRKLSRAVFSRYRDSLADTPIMANRHLQFLSSVFSWAIEKEYMADNPARGVARYRQTARRRYIEDWEFELVQGMAPDYVAVAMELAYLMRARRQEVLNLRREYILEDGILLHRGKGSQAEVTGWTERLRAAVKAAEALHPATISPWLLHNRDGSQIKREAFSTAWGRLMDRAMKKGLTERFTFHDIKRKGVTDDEEGWAGHRSDRMRAIYDVGARLKKATR